LSTRKITIFLNIYLAGGRDVCLKRSVGLQLPFQLFPSELLHLEGKLKNEEEGKGKKLGYRLASTSLHSKIALKAPHSFPVKRSLYRSSVTNFCRGLLKLNCFAFAYDQPEGKNKYRFNHITKAY